jgi:hypothetical protein|nr:MAG TPA: DNA polymerase II small subunit [Caudoviricetes sp.]
MKRKGLKNIIDLKKNDFESEEQYIWRIGSAKDAGLINLKWSSLSKLMNDELSDVHPPYGTSAYRKSYREAKRFYDKVFSKMSKSISQEEMDTLYKLKKQISDQRREHRKELTFESRFDHLCEELSCAAKQISDFNPLTPQKYSSSYTEREAVLFISDLHYGLVTENIWNVYNTNVCKDRLKKLVELVRKHLLENKVKKLHIVLLGDFCHGAIHVGCRVASEEEVCVQLMHISELIANVISNLADCVEITKVYSTYGNHMRTIQDKKESSHTDNMERLVPWWLKERLKNRKDIKIVPGEYYEFVRLTVCGTSIVATHGDLEDFKNFGVTMNTLFTKKFGETIDLAVMGDKHHLEEFEKLGIESVIIRSLCGCDDHSNGKRLYSSPGQTLMLFNDEEGRECTYNINLSR